MTITVKNRYGKTMGISYIPDVYNIAQNLPSVQKSMVMTVWEQAHYMFDTLSAPDKPLQLPNGTTILSIDYQAGVVLAEREGAAEPYITWEFYRGDLKSTSAGHYFDDIKEARADYQDRCNANFAKAEI